MDSFTTPEQQNFYNYALRKINESGIPVLVGGGYAFRNYSGIVRETLDLDLFCKAGDYPRLLKVFVDEGFETEITDDRWIVKTFKGEDHLDFIFNSVNSLCPVDDTWFDRAVDSELFGAAIRYVGPEEMIWCKLYLLDKYRYDGADINHIILKRGKELDWKWIMTRMEQHWHLLLSQVINFRFVYPSEAEAIPNWVIEELVSRLQDQVSLPHAKDKVCRGPLISQTQYSVDITEWGYKAITFGTV